MKRSRWCIAAMALVATTAQRAPAQDATRAARAEALFQEGRRLMAENRYPEACPKLAASQKLDPGPGTLMNLAACYEKNGQTASAWATWVEAEAAAERGERSDWAKTAHDRAASLLPSLSRLTIYVPPAADVVGLAIERDGLRVERAEWNAAVPVDPGVHPVIATAPRRQMWSTSVNVGPNGAKVTVTIPALSPEQSTDLPGPADRPAPPLPPVAPPFRPAEPQESGPAQAHVWGLTVAGIGVVSLGIGTAFALKASSTHSEAMTHCVGTLCSAEGMRLDDRARSQAIVATVTVATGLASVATGAVLYFVLPGNATDSKVALGMSPLSTGGSLFMRGAW